MNVVEIIIWKRNNTEFGGQMKEECQTAGGDKPYEVGYIIAYEDGRLDRFGCFPLPEPELKPEPLSILKKLVELEPTINEASYIFSSIRLKQGYDLNPQTIEFKKNDIRNFLRRFARPGIIRTGNIV